MRVIGIDPGYDRLGVAVMEKQNRREALLFSDCLTSVSKSDFDKRLLKVATGLEVIIKKWRPDVMALETLFFSKNTKTAMRVAEVRGVISYLAAKHNLKLIEYNPMEIKVAVTGSGRADKSQVTKMTKLLIPIKKEKILDDEYDAIAIALTCLAHLKL